jgi:hypothetical protein
MRRFIFVAVAMFMFCSGYGLVYAENDPANIEINSKKSDCLRCDSFAKTFQNKKITADLYVSLIESIMYFSHEVSNKVLDGFKMKHGEGIGGLGQVVANNFFVTQLAVSIITPDYVLEQCKTRPEAFLEEIGRSVWMASQGFIEEHPEHHWKTKIRQSFK